MKRYGLIGRPLGHSFSAGYFAAKFRREGITGCDYALYELPSIEALPELLAAPPELHEFGWDGTLRNVYTFDFPVTSIACDEVTGDCYAFRSDSEIYRFRLSE